ncbi:MAG: sirohydrochlorin cobaltochelatase [Ruminococcus sp.]|nr:sirohydrochlorin cobaltochelatase [Ruminococcus sp.]
MKIKKRGILTATFLSALMLAGCAGQNNSPTPAAETDAQESTAAKPVILAVSFGTSYNDSREKTIGAVEKAIADANPDYEVRRAFTAQTVIDILRERDNIDTDNVDEAFERLANDGVKTLVVQPTHVMSGYEYDDLIAAVDQNRDKFDSISVGAPLLTSDDDYSRVADALMEDTAAYNNEDTAIVFMGHGTEHSANSTYAKLQKTFASKNAANYYVGTVEATPSLDDIVAAVKAGGYKKVVLQPLMVVAGDHANNDMAGDEEDSWKTVLTKEGFEVECVLRGLGEIEAVQSVYADHVKEAANN